MPVCRHLQKVIKQPSVIKNTLNLRTMTDKLDSFIGLGISFIFHFLLKFLPRKI